MNTVNCMLCFNSQCWCAVKHHTNKQTNSQTIKRNGTWAIHILRNSFKHSSQIKHKNLVQILTQNRRLVIRDIEEVSLQKCSATLMVTTPIYFCRPCSISYITVVIVNQYETTSAVSRHYNRITHVILFVTKVTKFVLHVSF